MGSSSPPPASHRRSIRLFRLAGLSVTWGRKKVLPTVSSSSATLSMEAVPRLQGRMLDTTSLSYASSPLVSVFPGARRRMRLHARTEAMPHQILSYAMEAISPRTGQNETGRIALGARTLRPSGAGARPAAVQIRALLPRICACNRRIAFPSIPVVTPGP